MVQIGIPSENSGSNDVLWAACRVLNGKSVNPLSRLSRAMGTHISERQNDKLTWVTWPKAYLCKGSSVDHDRHALQIELALVKPLTLTQEPLSRVEQLAWP